MGAQNSGVREEAQEQNCLTNMPTDDQILARAFEHYETHRQLSLDLNQSRQSREYHLAEMKRAEAVIQELFE